MDDSLKSLRTPTPTGYRHACEHAERQRIIDQLLQDALQSDAMLDAEQEEKRR